MLRQFVIDKERNLMLSNDLLGTKCYANQLTDTIKNAPQEQFYSIGLYGSWGSGKSTIVETTKQQLESVKEKKYKVVIYDAWKYSGDSFRRMFLLQLLRELHLVETEDMKQFYEATTEELEPNISLRPLGFIIAMVILGLCVISAIILWCNGKMEIAFSLMMLISLGTLIMSLCKGLFYELKVTRTKSILFAPEQFEDCFRQMMKSVLKKNSWYVKLFKWVKNFILNNNEVHDLDKLVIVIDNLDRCDTSVVYSMLTDIKTFLGYEKYDVIFVVPVDHEALKKHLFTKQDIKQIHSDDKDSWVDAEEFLRKFFNVVIRIKKHRPDDLLHYVNELNKDQGLGFNPNTLSLVAKEYAENPRRMLQMLNNLTVEQALYDEVYGQEHETLIAACMIIREQYTEIVDVLLNNPDVVSLNALYEPADNPLIPLPLRKSEPFYAFMRLAKYTLQKASNKDFRTILTNTSNALSNLSDEIMDALDSFDVPNILRFVNDANVREDVGIEMHRRIKLYNANGAEDNLIMMLECIARINQNSKLREDELEKFDEGLKPIYATAPQKISYTNELCLLAKNMAEIGFKQLKNSLFAYIKDSEKEKEKLYPNYVQSIFLMFSDKEDCETLNSWAEDYIYRIGNVDTYKFNETQKRFLLTSAFVDKIIKDLHDRTQEHLRNSLIWCFDNLYDIDSAVYSNLFTKLKTLVGQTSRKPLQEYLMDIEFMMPILNSIKIKVTLDVIKGLFDIISSGRQMPNGTVPSINSEVNESNAIALAEFYFELYRISGCLLSINPSLSTIQDKCEEYVKTKLISMQKEGIKLLPFSKNIIKCSIVDDAWYELIPIVFIQEARVDDATLKEKLQILYDHRDTTTAVDLLVKITEDAHYNDLFVSLFNLTDYETLNRLPIKLLPRIVGQYTEENAMQFEKNNAMLRIVLERGEKEQKTNVRKTLVNRINQDVDLEGAIDVVNAYDGWNRTDKGALGGVLQSKLPEDNGEKKDEPAILTDIQLKIKDILVKWR